MSKEQIKSEIRFLKSKDMKELIHEADIGCCYDDCGFNFRRSTGKFCWTGKSPGKRKVHKREHSSKRRK